MIKSCLQIDPRDNVAVALEDVAAGTKIADGVVAASAIARGHKIALTDIAAGELVIRYANPIGVAKSPIKAGQHAHSHNIASCLSTTGEYSYAGPPAETDAAKNVAAYSELKFMGYQRPDGRVGVRNEIWIIPTVGCVNDIADQLARQFDEHLPDGIDAIRSLSHPFGCSQLGGDHERTRRLLAALAKHPNTGGVLLLGLGCENNALGELLQEIGDFDPRHLRYMNCQDYSDEQAKAAEILEQLGEYALSFKRQSCDISKLIIGMKCGGSDALSGVTANPLVGALCDKLCDSGASAILTETPEMFGAEHLLMARSRDRETFDKCVAMIKDFKQYYISRGMPIDENPSPGNIAGGITTLAEKSLGCVTKGGSAAVVDCIEYAQPVTKQGLTLLAGPGNDIVATTNLIAAGAQIVLFTTGRGTPLSGPVPTLKISSNSDLFGRKANWLDFDAGVIATGTPIDKCAESLLELVMQTASGEYFTSAERHGRSSIAIFHDGVTL